MTLEELRSEYQAVGIGHAILDTVRRPAARSLTATRLSCSPALQPGMPTPTKISSKTWSPIGYFATSVDYLFVTANSLEDFTPADPSGPHALSSSRAHSCRKPLERARRLVAEAPFCRTDRFGSPRFHLDGASVEHRDPTDAELADCVLAARACHAFVTAEAQTAPPCLFDLGAPGAGRSHSRSLPTSFSLRDLEVILQKC